MIITLIIYAIVVYPIINKIIPTIGAVAVEIVFVYKSINALFDNISYTPKKLRVNAKITAITKELDKIFLINSLVFISPAQVDMSILGSILKLLILRVVIYIGVIAGFFILFPSLMTEKTYMIAVLIYFQFLGIHFSCTCFRNHNRYNHKSN